MTGKEILELLVNKKLIKKNSEDDYSIITSGTKVKAKCQNLPDHYKGLSPKLALETFYRDCEIPHFVSTDRVRYELRTTTKAAEKIFMKIITDESIDFGILVARTKSWYSDPKSAKNKMSTYFESGQWQRVYEFEKSSETNNKFWT